MPPCPMAPPLPVVEFMTKFYSKTIEILDQDLGPKNVNLLLLCQN